MFNRMLYSQPSYCSGAHAEIQDPGSTYLHAAFPLVEKVFRSFTHCTHFTCHEKPDLSDWVVNMYVLLRVRLQYVVYLLTGGFVSVCLGWSQEYSVAWRPLSVIKIFSCTSHWVISKWFLSKSLTPNLNSVFYVLDILIFIILIINHDNNNHVMCTACCKDSNYSQQTLLQHHVKNKVCTKKATC